jgi:tartrate dehydrogenase/decarboxylase/D-malate dehydrogenase
MTRKHKIAVLPGDGIGKETVPESLKVLDVAARKFGFDLELTHYDWSCETYKESGVFMPKDGMEQLQKSDSILLGAVGWPGVPDHISLWGLLIPIRRGFDQYANVRPCKLMPGVYTPLANRTEKDIDFYVVRENTEGEYSSVGGRMFEGTEREFASQQAIFTRKGTDRILKYAFELAMTREKKHVTSATKSNGIIYSMPYWDERFAEMAKNYPSIRTDQYHIDILCAHFVQHPDWFDVVVGSNLFGDILSDLGPALAGSIGIAASANINPERIYPSMFEPPSRRCCAKTVPRPATWAVKPAPRTSAPPSRRSSPGTKRRVDFAGDRPLTCLSAIPRQQRVGRKTGKASSWRTLSRRLRAATF